MKRTGSELHLLLKHSFCCVCLFVSVSYSYIRDFHSAKIKIDFCDSVTEFSLKQTHYSVHLISLSEKQRDGGYYNILDTAQGDLYFP